MISQDKITHALACAYITLLFGLIVNWYVGVIVASVVAISKEIYDYYHPDKHTAELADLLADGVGIIVAVLTMLII